MKTYLTILLSILFTFIGVAVIINGKDTLTFNNEAHYPLMSVMKYHQALAVAHYLDQRDLPLSTHIRIEKQDLRPDTYSPLRDKYPNGGISLSIGELLTYTLQLSDNNACDILFEYIGGTASANQYLQTLGIEGFSISATENDMHQNPERCYENWSTPLSAARFHRYGIHPLYSRNSSLLPDRKDTPSLPSARNRCPHRTQDRHLRPE